MPCRDRVPTVTRAPSSPAPQTTCLAARIPDSAPPCLPGTQGVGGGYPLPAPAGVWGMVVLDKRASKLLEPLAIGGGGDGRSSGR